ncbi:MAG: hypothetical protein ABWK01_07065 [Infirmifilum sp.]
MIWLVVIVGVSLVLAALFASRVSLSLLLMSLGSAVLSLAIAALAGPLSGILVAALYAGALIALMAVWLVLAGSEQARRDAVYWVAIAFLLLALPAGLLIITMSGTQQVIVVNRGLSTEDVMLLAVILMVASGGVPYVLGGDKE